MLNVVIKQKLLLLETDRCDDSDAMANVCGYRSTSKTVHGQEMVKGHCVKQAVMNEHVKFCTSVDL